MVKPQYIAEIGINHNGNIELAKKHIDAAKCAGADYAKFQTYLTDTRAKPGSAIRDILKQCELSADNFNELKQYCDRIGIKFASTAFCHSSVNILKDIGCKHIKVASFQIANVQLLNYLSRQDWIEDLWISTGMASEAEIYNAVNILKESPNRLLSRTVFLHCVSQYPIQHISDYQLNNITYLREITKQVVGYSDHSIGVDAAVIATALGASLIEKHFTIDNSLEGADHAMSSNPEVFSSLVEKCNNTCIMIGNLTRKSSFNCENSCLPFKD